MIAALTPVRIGPLRLRNRIVKAATFEGHTPDGRATGRLEELHGGMARRGVALTTVAYGAVEPGGRTFREQLLVGPDDGLERVTEAVHRAGGAAALQLVHCGGFSKLGRPAGPSAGPNPYGAASGRPWIRAMGEADLARVIDAFGTAARRAQEAGFDAVEVHCGHGYLLSQFLSPAMNRRRDRWGAGSRERLAVEVVRRVSGTVGGRLAVLVKMNLADGVPGGATLEDARALAPALVAAGADAIVPSGGLVQRSAFYLLRGDVPVRAMAAAERNPLQRVALRLLAPWLVRRWSYGSSFFADDAASLLGAVSAPIGLLGGVDSAAAIDSALARGFAFVALGRALLSDPDLVERLEAGEPVVSRCTHCNECVAEMSRGGVRCVL